MIHESINAAVASASIRWYVHLRNAHMRLVLRCDSRAQIDWQRILYFEFWDLPVAVSFEVSTLRLAIEKGSICAARVLLIAGFINVL
jgi:hypothetical protein